MEQSQGKLGIVQTNNGAIHVVAAFGEADNDSIQNLDLKVLANKIELNGPISAVDDSFHINLNS